MSETTLSAVHARYRPLLPGILLALTVAAAARFVADHYGAPVMLFALLIGMAFNFLAVDPRFKPGLEFSSKNLLRIGIVLLGARITTSDIASLGISTFATVVGLIALTIGTGFVCGRIFNKQWRFSLLTGGSVAICGASAALAIASVIPHNEKTERNLLFTVVSVTTLSTIAMILYPILFTALGLTTSQSGFLVGATIHDVAQVVGAGYSISTDVGDVATIIKLLRVAMLPVVLVIIVLALAGQKRGGAKSVRLPLFVVGFAALTAVNSLGLLPPVAAGFAVDLSGWLLVVAIAALGVRTNMKDMLQLGWQHVAMVVTETLVLLTLAIAAVEIGLAG
ncbi:putative sulfate exporter family transporter [Aurantimonas aggregata]|uniref:Putative sulfate exporter family transporter n=1 Tax=Aurantimonas aggregata TaxID=2047720 RepID=A0A6L9MGX7_9HYPH|nr:putative sulfate exporter family transporter [Aurantimonas aggregata]NDV86780.1 putative sulfate exporter family transporter [Aurantimonas aggregata]